MNCPRCDGITLRQATEWLCLTHGSFAHIPQARDIKYEPATGGSEPGRQWRRITDAEIRDIQTRFERGESAPSIARVLGVGHTTVWRYVRHLQEEAA